jgi:hypothetical protein
MRGEQITVGQLTKYRMHNNACTCHEDHYEIHLGITTQYIDCNPTTSMTNNPPSGYHPNNPHVLSGKQQIIALSKVCNVNNTIILKQKIVVFSLVATTHLRP